MALKDRIFIDSGEYDGSTAVGHELDTQASLVTTGAKLLAIKNAGVEKFSIDKDGRLVGPTSGSPRPLSFFSMEPNGASAEGFVFNTNANLSTSGAKVIVVQNDDTEVWNIDKDGRPSSSPFTILVDPSEGSTGINTAASLVYAAGGGIVQLKEGTYAVTSTISLNDNVVLQGAGPGTILEHDGVYSGYLILGSGSYGSAYAINDISEDDTTIYYTTPAQAIPINVGDRLWIEGTDDDGLVDVEINEAASEGNPSDGSVQLVTPIKRNMTSITVREIINGKNIVVRNLRMTTLNSATVAYAIYFAATADGLIENIIIEGIKGSNIRGNICCTSYSVRSTVQNCRMIDAPDTGIGITQSIGFKVLNNSFRNVCAAPTTGDGAIILYDECVDGVVSGNIIDGSGGRGIAGYSDHLSRITISNNIISRIERGPIKMSGSNSRKEIIIANNVINNSDNEGINLQNMRNSIINGNTIKHIGTGGGIAVTDSIYINVCNNVINDVDNVAGIQFSNVDYSSISNNHILDINGRGIYLFTGCEYVTISGNTLKDVTLDGMRIEGSDHTIVGNSLKDITSTGIRVEADDCIVSSNNANGEVITINGTGVTSGLNKE